MNIIECKTLRASMVIGLQKGYSKEQFKYEEIITKLSKVQKEIHNKSGVKLSIKISNCDIVFFGQNEPSVSLEFIQYPKFMYEETKWETAVILFAKKLIVELEQNRTVIIFTDKTLMLENSEMIDPNIDFSS